MDWFSPAFINERISPSSREGMAPISLAQMIFVATILVFLSRSHLLDAKRYDLTAGWAVINNASLGALPQDTGARYRILRAGGEQILSDNGTYSLAFYDPHGTGDFFLSVLLTVGKNASSASASSSFSLVVPVWTANVNSSASEDSALLLTSRNRKFIFLSSSGYLLWSTHVTGISGIELEESGNLVLYSDVGVLWQSFDYPTDTLVPGQKLVTGMSIISSNNSSTSSGSSLMKAGQFIGTMEPSGLVLYVMPMSKQTMSTMLREPQPYHVWSIGDDSSSSSSSLPSALKACDSYQAVLKFSTNTIEISYEPSSSSVVGSACAPPLQVYHKQKKSNHIPLQYLKLETDGDLVLYQFDDAKQSWEVSFSLSEAASDSCKLPTTCGSYGVCSDESQCRCIEDSGESDPTSSKCSAPQSVSSSCMANEAQNHHFVNVSGATYFSNMFLVPDIDQSTIDDCLSLCVSNCSCAAAFYDNTSTSCYFVEEVMGSLTIDPKQPGSTAFIKLQNSKLVSGALPSPIIIRRREGGYSRSARRTIIALTTTCVVLFSLLVLVVLIMRARFPHAYNKIMRR